MILCIIHCLFRRCIVVEGVCLLLKSPCLVNESRSDKKADFVLFEEQSDTCCFYFVIGGSSIAAFQPAPRGVVIKQDNIAIVCLVATIGNRSCCQK